MHDHPPFESRFFKLTLINILANITVPLAGLVDTAMLGHLAEIRFLAGVALGAILFDYVYWTFGFLRMGTTGTAAQALGRGDEKEVHLVLLRSATVALGLAAVVLVLQKPLCEAVFTMLSGEPDVEQAGRVLASCPDVTHCYERPPHETFPYNLFAMVHAREQDVALGIFTRLSEEAGLTGGRMLTSVREFKKSSPVFFAEE